jgi:hypothetical protein
MGVEMRDGTATKQCFYCNLCVFIVFAFHEDLTSHKSGISIWGESDQTIILNPHKTAKIHLTNIKLKYGESRCMLSEMEIA